MGQNKHEYMIDSSVWIAAYITNDTNHQKAKAIIAPILRGNLGIVHITDYIFNEVVNYIRKKIDAPSSVQVAEKMLNSPHIEIIQSDTSIFNAGYHIFEKYDRLSFTDATIVVIMKNKNIEYLYSFDDGFDGIKGIYRLNQWIEIK